MKTEQKIPALRFPEFEGEWEVYNIGNLVDNTILFKPLDGNHGNIHPTNSDYVPEGIPFIMANNIKEGVLDIQSAYKISKEQAETLKKGFAIEGDILLTHKGSVGLSTIVPKLSDDYIVLTPQVTYYRIRNKKALNNLFLLQSFKTSNFRNLIRNLAAGGTRPYIGITEQLSLKISFPSLPEQQKIADFLSATDKRLEFLKEKKQGTEDYKRGAMQRIFSQELRFTRPDGSAYPDWEEKKLGEIGEIITGKTPSTNDELLWNGNILFITPTDIIEGRKYQKETLRTVINQKEIKVLPLGSVVYTCIGSIGKIAITTIESCTNQQINSIVIDSRINNEFIYYTLKHLTPYIKSLPATTTLPIINKTEFSAIKISLPSLEEQTQIANFLSAIDVKIEKLSEQIEATENYKKGLLQQMFV